MQTYTFQTLQYEMSLFITIVVSGSLQQLMGTRELYLNSSFLTILFKYIISFYTNLSNNVCRLSSNYPPPPLHIGELSIDTSIHKESYDVVPNDYLLRTLSSESINTKSPSSDFQSVDSRDTFLIRSVSSSSLSSSLKMDSNEMTSNEQEIRNQLSVVRAKLAKDEEKLANNGGNSDVFSDLGYDIIDDSVGNIQSAQIDDSLDSPSKSFFLVYLQFCYMEKASCLSLWVTLSICELMTVSIIHCVFILAVNSY
ncbi:unnamed protein product [Trichobilharzia regenti]|nr:unnamed protein product [Trichobilharzia regenti]